MPRRSCLLIALFLAGCACSSRAADAPATGQVQEVGKEAGGLKIDAPLEAALPADKGGGPSAGGEELVRNLISEAGRAELDAGGILIDFGSLDMHKYSRGGWLSGWGRNTLADTTSVATIDARKAWLDVVSERPIGEIVLRARGRGKLAVSTGEGRARNITLSAEMQVHRLPLAKPLAPGRHRIHLVGRKATIDWLWLSEGVGATPPDTQRLSSDQASLLAHDERSYNYYLIADARSRLRFRLAGEATAEASIRAKGDGVSSTLLWQGKVAEAHKPVSIALPEALADQPLQLRLENRGGKVAWQELALVRETGAAPAVVKPPKNVILLLIDTQRADSFSVVNPTGAIGASAYEALVKTSTTFQNAYNSENWTKPSIATIDTGLYPSTHLARWRKDKCSSDLQFLSEALKAAGFATAALVSNMSAGPKFGFDQGWAKFEKTENAEHAFGRALTWLDARDTETPFFLYVQTIDPHVPFSVPRGSAEALYGGPYNGKLGPGFEQSEEDAINAGKLKLNADDARWLRALYDAEVLYHDEHLGKFVEALRERDILQDTAFVILNDHGEEFGEHGRWGHSWTMGDALHRSPLLMHFPGFFPAEAITEVVEHVDVAPTIVASLGLPAMPSAEGESLLPLLHEAEHPGLRSALLFGRPKQRALRIGDFKLVLKGNQNAALFNTARDPKEATDLLASHPIAHRLCEVALGEAIANPKKRDRLLDRSEQLKVRPQFIAE